MKKKLLFGLLSLLIALGLNAKEIKVAKSYTTFSHSLNKTRQDASLNWSIIKNNAFISPIIYVNKTDPYYVVNCLDIVSEKVIWAYAYKIDMNSANEDKIGNTILISTDGGNTFSSKGEINVNSVLKNEVMSIAAFTDSIAVVVTGPSTGDGEILRTSDAGKTWSQVHTKAGSWFDIVDNLDDGKTVWALSDPISGKFYVTKSTDRGLTWAQPTNQPAAITGESGANNAFDRIGNKIWVGSSVKNRVLVSENGPDGPWTVATTVGAPTSGSAVGAISFSSATGKGIAGFWTSKVLNASTDGGKTFSKFSTNYSDTTHDIRFIRNSNKVYAATQKALAVSYDGGTNWGLDKVEGFNRVPIYCVRFLNDSVGFASGSAGVIAKYTPTTNNKQVTFNVDLGMLTKKGQFNLLDDVALMVGNFTNAAGLGDNWSYQIQLNRRTTTSATDTIFSASVSLPGSLINKDIKVLYQIYHNSSIKNSIDTLTVRVPNVDVSLVNYNYPVIVANESYINTAKSFALAQNYPNPFNPSTKIQFSVPTTGNVKLNVYNSLGQEVATLVNEVKSAGNYTANFNASSLPSGIYMYSLTTNGQTITKKMMLIK